MQRKPAKAVSLVGAGRSGSTVLANLLAEIPGIVGAGELRWLWCRDLPQQRLCGCGEPPARCPVWSEVVRAAMRVSPADQGSAEFRQALERICEAQNEVAALSRRAPLLTGSGTPSAGPHAVLAEATVAALEALLTVTGAHTVVDASKRPQEAAVLSRSGAFEHYVVHMVRDPRAVVHSWRRVKPLPESTGRAAMGTRSQRKTLWRWVENAAGAELLRRHVPPDRWLFLRYEDFAARPREAVRRVLDLIGETQEAPFVDDTTVVLGENHNLSGNPNRFTTGAVRIVPDREWMHRMSRRDQAGIAAATLPFLLRYGYPLSTHEAASPAQ